jgi:Ca2+-binding RTX toxin-like protein
MAVLIGTAATEGFDMVDLNEINFANQDPNGTNSSTQYSWITGNLHDVQVTGSGIANNGTNPTAGTVTQVDIDLSDNNFATPDIVITGVPNASLVTITNTSIDFLNGVFGGDDTMTGTGFADQLKGVGGDDNIDGAAGNDTIFGGTGADTLSGSGGSNELHGDSGNDFLFEDASSGADVIDGGGDDDYVVVATEIAIDSFNGGDGTGDTIDWSGASQDGATFDLAAGTAVDGVFSEVMTNFENLKGTGGDDGISGSGANNLLLGLGGSDTIDGLGGDDTVDGGDGNDSLTDSGGDDSIIGGDGNDVISESSVSGVDTLSGDGGDDLIFVGSTIGADSFAGGAGVDTIDWSTSTQNGGNFNLGAGTAASLLNTETMTGFENLKGTGGADTITGSAASNLLRGLAGNDSIFGAQSADTIQGGDGNDTLDGGTAFDTVDYSDKGGGVNVNVINGVALTGGFINSSGFYQGGTQEDTISNFENIIGTSFADRLIAGSTSAVIDAGGGNDFIFAFSGNDTLRGGSGDDQISTALSSDMLFGESGNDTLNGGTGLDTLDGGADSDTATYADRSGGVNVNLLAGTATTGGALNGAGFYAGGFVEDSLVSVENIIGSNFGDRLVTSNANGRIDAGLGADNISGLNGADTLNGGAGNDTMSGGAGNDTFIFATGSGADRITDMVEGAGVADVINLQGFGASFDTFGEVIAAATQVGGDVVFNFGSGNTLTVVSATVAGFAANDFTFS